MAKMKDSEKLALLNALNLLRHDIVSLKVFISLEGHHAEAALLEQWINKLGALIDLLTTKILVDWTANAVALTSKMNGHASDVQKAAASIRQDVKKMQLVVTVVGYADSAIKAVTAIL